MKLGVLGLLVVVAWMPLPAQTPEFIHQEFLEPPFVVPDNASSEVVVSGPDEPGERLAEGIGREVAHLATLRRMSVSVAGMLQAGKTPAVEAAVVKDLGTNWEQALPNKVRLMAPPSGDSDPDSNDDRFEEALAHTTLIAPKLTIQGGTTEILRGIIARGLGLR